MVAGIKIRALGTIFHRTELHKQVERSQAWQRNVGRATHAVFFSAGRQGIGIKLDFSTQSDASADIPFYPNFTHRHTVKIDRKLIERVYSEIIGHCMESDGGRGAKILPRSLGQADP